MAEIIYSDITLDVSGISLQHPLIRVKQNDRGTRGVRATILNDDEPFAISSGEEILVNFKRTNDQKTNTYEGTLLEDGRVQFTVPSWVLEYPYTVKCDISIVERVNDDYAKLTTNDFYIQVEETTITNSDQQDDDTINYLDKLIQEVDELSDDFDAGITRIETLEGDLSDDIDRVDDLEDSYEAGIIRIEAAEGIISGFSQRVNTLETGKADKTITITGTGVLSGGGDLSQNRIITHNEILGTAKTTADVYKIKIDKYGHITEAVSAGLAAVATSGSYNDLSDQPAINNGTLTIQVEGTSKGTFTANQAGNTTINITAASLGLSSAMKFIGTTTTQISDGATTNPVTINGSSVTATGGNVVLYNNKEFLWNSSLSTPAWEELGDESSHALKTVTITGTGVLGGGGSLEANRTITHNAGNAVSKASGFYKFSTDAYSHIGGVTAVVKKDLTDLITSMAAASGGTDLSLVTTGEKYIWNNKGTYSKPNGGIPASDLAETYYLASNPNGYTSNTGTVTSVRVQAGTGLASSQSTAQTGTLNTTIGIASGYKLPTTTEWNAKADADSYLPLSAGSASPLTGDIYYSGGNRSAVAIRFKAQDVNGTGVIIGDGGLVHIGAGESAKASNDATWGYTGGTEDLYLTADGAVFLASNCNTIANRKVLTLGADGNFRPNASGQNLGTTSNMWGDIYMSSVLLKGATGVGGCSTAAGTAAKTVTISNFGTNISSLASGNIFAIYISNANTAASALTLNINSLGAKPIYINNAASSSSNYTLQKGWHTFYYNGTNFYTQDYTIVGYDAGTAVKGGYQIPAANGAWDLGVSAYRWRNLFLTGQMNTSSTTDSSSTTTGSIVTKGGIGVAKNIYCGANVYASSDRRLKENIKDAELDCGAVIDELPIKEFNFKSDEEKKVVVGAIAQELQEILPEKYRATLVSGSEDSSYSINEGKLLYVAIGALKDEMKKVASLEKKVASIEAQLGA